MRRRNISKEKIVSALVATGIVAVLGAGVFMVVDSEDKDKDNNIVDLNETKAPDLAFKVDETKYEIKVENTEKDTEKNTERNTEKETSEVAKETQKQTESETKNNGEGAVVNGPAVVDPLAKYTFTESSKLEWPVKGEIILGYSVDSTVLFKTLGMYKTNPAILIAADYGANVGVAADGIVSKVTESEETGITVSVAVGSDYVVTYGQLDGVVVKAGDTVKKGQLLGTVAEPTAYYVEEGNHVYFAVTKAGNPVNPEDFLSK